MVLPGKGLCQQESSSIPSSGAPLRRTIQDLLGDVSQGGEGRALGKLLDEVSAFLQALAELGVQGNAAWGIGGMGRVTACLLQGKGPESGLKKYK